MANPIFDLTGKKPSDTYRQLVQVDTSSLSFYDGSGNSLTSSLMQVTASYAATASYAFVQLTPEYSASWSSQSFSASFSEKTLLADQAASAGFATNSTSASHALNADNANSGSHTRFAYTSSYAEFATSSSFAISALNADNANSAAYASNAGFSTSGSHVTYAESTNTAITTSWANDAVSASWAPYVDTGTTLYTASLYEITSSWADQANIAAQSLASDSSSWATSSFSSSYALKATDADISLTSTSASHALRADISDDVVSVLNHTMSINDLGDNVYAFEAQSLSGSGAIISQAGYSGPPDTGKAVLSVARAWVYDFQPQSYPLLRLANFGTGSADPALWIDYYDNTGGLRRVFTVDCSGSIQGKEFYGTSSYALMLSPAVTASYANNAMSASWADNSLSASYAPTVTVGLTNTTKSWVDNGTMMTQSMYIDNGLVISWSVQT